MSANSFPPFSLSRLLTTVFAPEGGERLAILIDLDDPRDVVDLAFLDKPECTVQRYAHEDFYKALHGGVMAELGLTEGDLFAYQVTGGANLDMPDRAVRPDGKEVSLAADVYPAYDIILCISTFSATAPLTASAKRHGFRGATLHGLNEIILSSGLAVDYDEVSRDAEKLRLGMTRADHFEIDFEFLGRNATLRLITDRQEAQKSHGLCRGPEPDVANLPAGEIYYVPESAEGEFPMKYEDGTIGLMQVTDGFVRKAVFLQGDEDVVRQHNAKLQDDPTTGEIGELGFGTQELPFAGADIQDEKVLGTLHVATGRSDHLGGDITPDKFEDAGNATHDDILFAPHKTPEIRVVEARMQRDGNTTVLIRDYQPSQYMRDLLDA